MIIKWLRIGSFAALDQALLSAVSFLIAVAFIRHGEKAEYGLYVLLLSLISYVQGVQNAIFLSPFTTIYPQRVQNEKYSVIQFFVSGQLIFIGVAVSISFVGLLGYHYTNSGSIDTQMAAAFAVAVAGGLMREAWRTMQYVHGRAGTALFGDIVFGAFVVMSVTILASVHSITVTAILAISGVACILPLMTTWFATGSVTFSLSSAERTEFWACGRWAVVGSSLTWVNLFMYPYIVAASFGIEAVAEMNAARLFMVPFLFSVQAWSNLLRPKFAAWFMIQQHQRMQSVSIKFAVIGVTLIFAYTGAVVAGYPWLASLAGQKYSGILSMIIAWAVVYTLGTVRAAFAPNLMVDETGYKILSRNNAISLVVFIPAMMFASKSEPILIIGALGLIEAIETILTIRYAARYWRDDVRS